MPQTSAQHTNIPAADAPKDLIEHQDRVAYQFSAIVQAHAALLVFDPRTARVVQTSANLHALLGIHPDDALAHPPEDLFDPDAARTVRDALGTDTAAPVVLPDLRTVDHAPLIGRIHSVDGLSILEIESPAVPPDCHTLDPARLWVSVEQLAVELAHAQSITACAGVIARHIRAMVGTDRCMVYRFDEDWNGEVIAEDRGPNAQDSYLGLHFPARDIPRSARDMLAAGPVRVTTDQHADPAPLVPRLNPLTGRDLNLFHTRARATDGACRTYYRNMGVRATLVMPILIRNQLWGLISCHHAQPLHAPATCDAPLSVVRCLADAAVEIQSHQDQHRAQQRATDIHQALADISPADPAWIRHLTDQITGFRQLLDADACVVRVAGETHTDGSAPPREVIDRLLHGLVPTVANHPVATNRIAQTHPALADIVPHAAGVLAIPLMSRPGDAVLWLRRELPQRINWAGDPGEGERWDRDGQPILTPRASFKLWQQTTAGTARQWTDFDIHVARTAAINIGMMLLSWQTSQASRSKSEFLANMSHEIRTPMTAIMGFTDMLAEDETDPQRADFLATIKRNGAHLLGILNDILDLSKIEAGRLAIVPEPTDPRRLAEDCLALLAPAADARSIALHLDIDPALPPTIRTDPLRLRQVLLNIMGNAVKFTPSGSVTLRLRARPDAVRFEIQDTGIGMTPEQAARALLPFEQADASTTRHFGGTGLGLTISARLIAMLGDDLAIDSTPGVGTTVRFRIDDQARPDREAA